MKKSEEMLSTAVIKNVLYSTVFMKGKAMETERLILRPWRETDAESLYEYAKDDRIGPITGWQVHTSVENSREVIKNVLSAAETYAVCRKEDNIAIGDISLMIGKRSNIGLPENEAEIGYWIGAPFWGRGLIPEALRELIRYAFDNQKLERLWCGCFDGNEKSKRVLEKCGFVYHHTERDIFWKPMNDIRTEHLYCLEKRFARPLLPDEIPAAIELVWEVFLRFEAPDYGREGVQTFRNFLDGKEGNEPLCWYGVFENGHLVGVLAMRAKGHISLFFVQETYQGKGYGRQLFERMTRDYDEKSFTVNSSPYALPIYQKLGFTAADAEQCSNGIRFTPMKYIE